MVYYRHSSIQMCSNSGSLILMTTLANFSDRPTRLAIILALSSFVRQKKHIGLFGVSFAQDGRFVTIALKKTTGYFLGQRLIRCLSHSMMMTSCPRLSRKKRAVMIANELAPMNTALMLSQHVCRSRYDDTTIPGSRRSRGNPIACPYRA